MKILHISYIVFAVYCLASTSLLARDNPTELSLGSGIYKSSEYKFEDPAAGTESKVKRSEFNLQLRYGQLMEGSANLAWYMTGGIQLVNWSGDNAPDNGSGIIVGGGMKLYFDAIGDRFLPFVDFGGELFNEKIAPDVDSTTLSETEQNGIRYYSYIGFRILMGSLDELDSSDLALTLDVDYPIFISNLYRVRQVEDASGAKSTRTDFEIFAQSANTGTDALRIGLSLIF